MTDTLYFLFLDEIYTPNLNEFRKRTKEEIFLQEKHHHFGISGTIVAASDVYDLYSRTKKIKSKYFPDKNKLIFHYTATLNKKEDFARFKNNYQKYRAYTDSLKSFVVNSRFKFSCVFVDKHELIKKYGVFDKTGRIVKIKKIGSNLFPKSQFIDYNLYLLCLRHLLVSFYNFISDRQHPARGIIVAEARGKREDDELRTAFQKIYYYGVSSIKPTQFRRIILDLFIVPKTQDYVGTQLADMIVYPVYDSEVPNHSARKDHFINFDKVLKRKLLEEVKVIP